MQQNGYKRSLDNRPEASDPHAERLLLILFFLVLFSPQFDLAATVRLDEILALLLFPVVLVTVVKQGIPKPIVPFLLVLAGMTVIFFAQVSIGISAESPWKWIRVHLLGLAFLVYWGVIVNSLVKRTTSSRWMGKVFPVMLGITAVCSALAILQYIDHALGGHLGVLRAVATLYPYSGDLSSTALEKAYGYSLKMGGIGRVTATFSGQPILLGDGLALLAVMLLPVVNSLRRRVVYALILIALGLTLSRGAWAGYLFGIVVYGMLSVTIKVRKRSLKKPVVVGIMASLIALALWVTGLLAPILWRISGTVATLFGQGGVPVWRLETVWPQAIARVDREGSAGWLIGAPKFEGPTDSQYLLWLVDSGLLGGTLFVLMLLVMLGYSVFRLRKSSELKGLHKAWIASVAALLVMAVVHPIWQGNRLVSLVMLFWLVVTSNDWKRTSLMLESRPRGVHVPTRAREQGTVVGKPRGGASGIK